jgi:DNA-binding transcriptional ArsR family regulator
MTQSIFDLQANLCKAMSNATRLRVVHQLRAGPCRVGEITKATGLAQSNVSQHLAVLRLCGVVVSERVGNEIVYRIANPKIIHVCDLMREVLSDQASERSELIETLNN